MSALDAATAAKLVKVLNLLGSSHDGERASAALAAHRLLHTARLTWEQVIIGAVAPVPGPQPTDTEPPADTAGRARWAAARLHPSTDKERRFLASMSGWAGDLSERQVLWLDALIERARAGRPA
jgi:hypothetical protein